MDASFNPVTFNSGNAVNSSVNSIVIQSDGKIIAGGAFYSFFNNPARNRITRLNSDGSLDATFTPGTGFNNTVSSLTIQADGKIIVGGDFTSFNGTSRNRIARINIDGSLDATFNPGIGFYNNNTYTDIYAIIFQLDGKIIVGGVFTSYNGTPINNIARINSDGSLDVTFNPMPGFDGDVYATAIQPDGKIIVGGEFNFFNGVARVHIARLNSDGSIDLTFNPLDFSFSSGLSWVNSIGIQTDGKIIVGGNFTLSGNQEYLIRLNSDGSLDASFNPGIAFPNGIVNPSCHSITIQTDGKIIVGGNFTSFNGTTRNRIARLNTDGSLDATFNPGIGFDSWVHSTSIQTDGKIMVGGKFNSFNGSTRNHIARLNSDGSLDATFNPGIGFDYYEVHSIAIQSDGKTLVGGDFTSFNGTPRNKIARLNSDGSLDATFNPGTGFSYDVNSIAIQSDGKIIAVGGFASFNGTARKGIARINSNGSLDASFNPGTGLNTGGSSTAIQADGKIIVGGGFTQFNGFWRHRIVRLLNCFPTTTTDLQIACNSYTWIDGNTYTTSNNSATFNIVGGAVSGCDSIVTLSLTINSPVNTVSVSSNILTANETGANYQWINCAGNSIIAGATNQSYTATANGNYAVIIALGTCYDTSACVNINTVSINEPSNSPILIYPNPNNGAFSILTNKADKQKQIEIYNTLGEIVFYKKLSLNAEHIINSGLRKGLYFVKILSEDKTETHKIIIE